MQNRNNHKEFEVMSELSSSQLIAAACIAGGSMKREAANKAGVTPQTISSWMQYEAFQDAIQDFRLTVIYATRNKLRSHGIMAIETLVGLMKSGNDGAKLGAAKLILETINLTPGANGHEMGLWDTSTGNYNPSLFLPTPDAIDEFIEEDEES